VTPSTASGQRRVAVAGATGYVGTRVVPRLLEAGWAVTCLVRSPRKIEGRPWARHPSVAIVEVALDDTAALTEALRPCSALLYLVHSMLGDDRQYAERDRRLADSATRAAGAAGLSRIVYLGGLGDERQGALSEHLESRREVEAVLGAGSVPVTVFRAAMIIGAGSSSFEILRFITERLPVMVTPQWLRTKVQPVAIDDVLAYLVASLDAPETAGEVLEIGGPDVLTYTELIQLMAKARGLPPRRLISVPVLTPKLSAWWLYFVTPIDWHLARALAEGLRNTVVVQDHRVDRLLPRTCLGAADAIARALREVEQGVVDSHWSSAGIVPGDADWAGGTARLDQRTREIDASPAAVFAAVRRVGGNAGWYRWQRLWRLRGWLDRLVGGPGLGRGRRHPDEAWVGEAIDFWRVASIEPDRHFALRAEMRAPGEAMLEFHLEPLAEGRRTRLTLSARYMPKGLVGLLYWYAVAPFHALVFPGLLEGIAAQAERSELPPPPPPPR
jgi:uncharacterized protein YbjT (DUF2867 family)